MTAFHFSYILGNENVFSKCLKYVIICLQIVVESSKVALEYGDLLVVENSAVNQDLRFDNQLMHLYVMTERNVRYIYKLPVSN